VNQRISIEETKDSSDPGEIQALASDTRIYRRLDTGGLPVVTNLKGVAPKSPRLLRKC
jgi:hypothetical protein